MDDDSGPLPPSYTQMKFPVTDGYGHVTSSHDPVSEVKRLYEKVEEHVNELRNNKHPDSLETVVDETTLPRDLRQDILSLYALSSALIEKFATDLVVRELVADEHQDNDAVREAIEKRGVSNNLRLLFDINVIENGLHGELQSITGDRNDYVHDPDATLYIEDYDEFLSRTRKCKRATKGLAVELDGEDVRTW